MNIVNQPTKLAPTALIVDVPNAAPDCNGLPSTGTLDWLLGGKPLVRHLIEELQQLGVKNCFILSHGCAATISTLIKDKLHWSNGMRIEVLDFDVDASAALMLFSALARESGLLVLEPSSVNECCLEDFLTQANQDEAPLLSAVNQGRPLGISYLKCESKMPLHSAKPLNIGVQSTTLNSERAYVVSNFNLLKGRYRGRLPSLANMQGRQLWRHNRSYMSKKVRCDNITFIDRGTHVASGCDLDNVIAHETCVIEKNSSLKNVVLLPGTWVPKHTTVENALMTQDAIYPLANTCF